MSKVLKGITVRHVDCGVRYKFNLKQSIRILAYLFIINDQYLILIIYSAVASSHEGDVRGVVFFWETVTLTSTIAKPLV